MMSGHTFSAILLITGIAGAMVASVPLHAQEEPAAPPPPYLVAQEKMKRLRTPGEAHRALSFMAGHWTIDARLRGAPDEEWETATSPLVGETQWLAGRRFLEIRYVVDPAVGMADQFESRFLIGYNNARHTYTLQWLSTFSTAIMQGEGPGRDDGSIVFSGVWDESLIGRSADFRWVFRPEGPDRFALTMYMTDTDGTEFHFAELVHTRLVDEDRPHLGRWNGTLKSGETLTFTFHPDGTALWSVVTPRGEVTMDMNYEIDARAMPHRIEVSGFTEGPFSGRTMWGIIDFPDANTLRLEWKGGKPGRDDTGNRPESFTERVMTCTREGTDPS